MADKDKKKGDDGEEEKEKEPEKGCCEKTGDCILATGRGIKAGIAAVWGCFYAVLTCLCYPVKECCDKCFYKIKMKWNPAMDPAYSELD